MSVTMHHMAADSRLDDPDRAAAVIEDCTSPRLTVAAEDRTAACATALRALIVEAAFWRSWRAAHRERVRTSVEKGWAATEALARPAARRWACLAAGL